MLRLEALDRVLVEERRCFCNRALCAFVTGLFVRRQEAGLLGIKAFEPFVDAGRNGLVGC